MCDTLAVGSSESCNVTPTGQADGGEGTKAWQREDLRGGIYIEECQAALGGGGGRGRREGGLLAKSSSIP